MWSNQKKNNNKCLLSPRQIANKAYTLAIKKLDRDDKRRRPQYSVRERLLLSNTMAKAEDILNKKAQTKSAILLPAKCEEDTLPPVSKQCKSENIVVQPNHHEQQPQPQISQDESKLLAVSMVAIAAAVVYSSIQQKDAFIQYRAPPAAIHHTNNTMTTMI